MLRTAHWTVEIFFDREPTGNAVGEAILLTHHGPALLARGHARSRKADRASSRHARTVLVESLADLVRNLGEPGTSGGEGR